MTAKLRSQDLLQTTDNTQLNILIETSRSARRKRSHLLLHAGPNDQVQRLVIAAQPGTYIRPHQHTQQWEMLILLGGCLDIITFSEGGEVLSRRTLNTSDRIVQIPESEWHGCFVRESDTVVIEVKPGPYRPNEFADWAPDEEHQHAVEFLRMIGSASRGQNCIIGV